MSLYLLLLLTSFTVGHLLSALSTTDVLRRSSVRSRTEIFQGTPEKDGDKSKASPKKVTKLMSQNGGHGTTDKKAVTEDELTSCGSVLTSGHAYEL